MSSPATQNVFVTDTAGEAKAPGPNGVTKIAEQLILKLVKTVTEADLTDAVNGEAQSIAIGTLPANAVVIASEVKLTTQFTGGGATAVKMDIGSSADLVAIVDQFDVFGATASGKRYSPGYAHLGLHGDHVVGSYDGAALVAQFTPDGSHTLVALTAGELTITVWYFVDVTG